MKPQKLMICGWGPYKDKVEIDFDKFHKGGIFLITGATGAGKTTIFDAISYALYGSLSGEIRDKERSSVRSDFADSQTPTYVELEMTHAGKSYRIRRNPEYMRLKKTASKGNPYTREKENALLYLPDGKVVEGVKEVNGYIRQLLALDYSQFKQLSMIAQGEFARLLTASPKDKTKIFREIFGTGIYERFTAALSARAKKHYVRMAEQKNKLEEDLHLLAEAVQSMQLKEETKEQFLALVSAEYPNYEQIKSGMDRVRKEAEASLDEYQKAFEDLEKQLEKKSAALVQKKEENKRVQELQRALETQQQLKAQKEEFAQKILTYKRAVNAGWVESADVRRRQAATRLQTAEEEKRQLKEQLEADKALLAKLMPFWEHREACRELLQAMEECEKSRQNIRSLELAWNEKGKELSRGREEFRAKEAESLKAKRAYEEALRLQKYAAIGMAAALLEPGKPCPVCGSTEHPAPARVSEEILSEEEIEELKRVYEEKEGEAGACHERVIMLKTQTGEYEKSLEAEQEQEAALREKLEKVTEPVCVELAQMTTGEARRLWQTNCDTMQRLQAVVKERELRMSRLKEQRDGLHAEKETAEREFAESLKQYGFKEEQEYYQAYLDKAHREALSREIEQYQGAVTANVELVKHLRKTVKTGQLWDTEALEQEICRDKARKEEFLKQCKTWEQFLKEFKKTGRLFAEKLDAIERESKEYGCIKELENIAGGNNGKKLVFEQYVLAGFFEQILQAGNIRFRKMTMGRFEMYRSREVGDGRTKDNLEIEVMDFYTGKRRSVRTLSGGESFKASLCLALGLSDVIQAMHGGIKVDTLFIDEGFGALDSESLDQACATLMSLVDTQRLIGIISHVQELRERIDRQIVIDKTGSGSTLKVVVN